MEERERESGVETDDNLLNFWSLLFCLANMGHVFVYFFRKEVAGDGYLGNKCREMFQLLIKELKISMCRLGLPS